MKHIFYALNFIVIFSLSSCSVSETNVNVTDVVVVETYLENEKEVNVKLSKILPFTEDTYEVSLTIDSAEVYIENQDVYYLITPVHDKKGEYVCLDTNLKIESNETYNLFFDYNGYKVSASTTIPIKPQNAKLSTNNYYIDSDAGGFSAQSQGDPLIVSWDNPDNSYHLIVAEYLENTYSPINSYLPSDTYDQFRKVSTDPINDNTVNLTTRKHLLFFGSYRIIIYKINEEYVSLYENISQSTLNMTEPLTNIVNGVGIFTGINSETLFLEIREQ